MPFKKLHQDIQEKLTELEITTPTPFQVKSIPVIKSGANIFCTAPKDSGKTTTLILTTLQKLKCKIVGTAPRAIVLVENNDRALALEKAFLSHIKFNSLRIYCGDEKLHIDVIKSEIFEGTDVLIATPKIINKLLLLEGLSTSQLKIFNIDDADFLSKNASYTDVMAITQSLGKCQFVLYSEKMNPMLKRLESFFMAHSRKITI